MILEKKSIETPWFQFQIIVIILIIIIIILNTVVVDAVFLIIIFSQIAWRWL